MFLREPSHILLLVLVLILLFGAKRLPDSAKALGRSLRLFKGELKSNEKEGQEGQEGKAEHEGDDSSEKPGNTDKPSKPE